VRWALEFSDPDRVLQPNDKDIIEGFFNTMTKAQVALLVIKHMDQQWIDKHDTRLHAAEVFARTVHDTWGVGDKSTQNGVVLFFSLKDRVAFISTGSGVQSALPAYYLTQIIEDLKPELQAGQYGLAIQRTQPRLSVSLPLSVFLYLCFSVSLSLFLSCCLAFLSRSHLQLSSFHLDDVGSPLDLVVVVVFSSRAY
jgi:hypothetical protein